MQNPFYFSDYFKPIAYKLKFIVSVIAKFLTILFRRRKGIKLLQLDYSKKYLFDKSYLIISYKFKNALWYNFKNLKKTTEKQSVVFNLKNLETNNITLIVYGFFQKKIYDINILPEKALETKSFKTIISGINQETTFAASIKLDRKSTFLNLPKINVAKTKIAINHSSYNQTDFL
jgi:hypothetical protein